MPGRNGQRKPGTAYMIALSSRGSAHFSSLPSSPILLFDLGAHPFVPTLARQRVRRARSLKDGALAPPDRGLSLTDRAPRYAGSDLEGGVLAFVSSTLSSRHVIGRSSVEVHGSCDDRINLYPAAPFRLATLLRAWTYRAGRMGLIARTAEGFDPFCEAVPQSHTRPAQRAPKERRNCVSFSVPTLVSAPQVWRLVGRVRARHSAIARSPACVRRRRS